jgi:Holliday junction resolvase RusA-like endonuclease
VLVSACASQALRRLPAPERRLLTAGVRLTVAFYLPRPKSLPRRVTAHVKAPDLDKLVRSVGDALTRVVFADDAQVVDLVAMKRYAAAGTIPQITVRVEPTLGCGRLATDQPLFALGGTV